MGHRLPMQDHSSITIDVIRELRQQLMAALDDLSELEHRFQKAHHTCQKAGKVVEAIRSWKEEESPAPEPPSKEKPSTPAKVKFLSVADLAQRWGCSSKTVERMARANLISETHFSARMVRVAIEEVERYERECRG